MLRFTKQLPCPRVTAFSLTSLFLERIWRKNKISLRSKKNQSAKPNPLRMAFYSFVTSYVYNTLMNGADLPFSREKVLLNVSTK